MRITKEQLKQIIKEEIRMVMEMTDQMDSDLMNKILNILGQDGFVSVEETQKQLAMERSRGGDLDPDDSEVQDHIDELVSEGILSGPDDEGDYEEGPEYVANQAYEIY